MGVNKYIVVVSVDMCCSHDCALHQFIVVGVNKYIVVVSVDMCCSHDCALHQFIVVGVNKYIVVVSVDMCCSHDCALHQFISHGEATELSFLLPLSMERGQLHIPNRTCGKHHLLSLL